MDLPAIITSALATISGFVVMIAAMIPFRHHDALYWVSFVVLGLSVVGIAYWSMPIIRDQEDIDPT